MRAESSKKMTSFLQRILGGKKPAHQALSLTGTPAIQAKSAEPPGVESRHHAQTSEAESKLDLLFAFVDPKDPFAPGELAEEQFPGPILSILSAKKFDCIFLFYTPHTRKNAQETKAEALQRYPDCRITLRELPISDPKNYRALIGQLRAIVQKLALAWRMRGGQSYVCVSSGTAEMRAAWFLLAATGVVPAKFLQVGTPARPLFGKANVREVQLESSDWENIRDLALPTMTQLRGVPTSSLSRGARGRPRTAPERSSKPKETLREASPTETGEDEIIMGSPDEPTANERAPLQLPGLDEVLLELGIYVGSATLRHAAEQAAIAADSHLPVLLQGETGTGKEEFAKLIHRLSPRFPKDMVVINCAAIPMSLAESYLFGHVKGAFTDASTDHKGIFESADGSTLFLDEIAELTLEVQGKLLRVLQDGVVQRMGTTVPRHVDLRIIAASNRDLRKEVSAGRFREDLYFRLDVVSIRLPPLRERSHEIANLALILLREINQRRHKPRKLGTEALMRLERYHWPGNVRELAHVLERSVLYARDEVIRGEDLLITDNQQAKDMFASLPEPRQGFSVEEYLNQARKQLFLRALDACKGNQSEAAAMLGVSKQAVSKFVAGRSDNPG
jgi:transcriptional regulator with AAA-type ATPase domain